MSDDTLFAIVNTSVLPFWAILAFAPRWTRGVQLIASWVAPAGLAMVYAFLLVRGLSAGPPAGDFGSLAGVTALFSEPAGVLVGWVHYLAFDLFIGAWEVRDAQRLGISHLAVLPCLFFTLMFGPVGLLLYLALRVALRREVGVST